jgi:DEAD/DEAH box helicase domain-containing protein
MIPLTIANQVRATLVDYLRTTFSFQDEKLEEALTEFMRAELFRGPYVDLRLPFRRAAPDASLPLEIAPPFTPYVHQVAAVDRLHGRDGHHPQPTLVVTGTGSGKTECFLYPILDTCYQQRQQPGIKAIILYPMNALASDQAGRLAKAIWQDARLRNQITAGIYIGGENPEAHKSMGPDHLIDDRETLRRYPPDILLTNYRMLDFLLLRPEDKPLWAQNGPESLRYMVLDELHTYDGAQGSDVAGLIRRLKARLGAPPGFLCPVGTSATIGNVPPERKVQAEQQASAATPPQANAALITFAGEIFGEAFDAACVVGEIRLSLEEFLDQPATGFALPDDLDALSERAGEAAEEYMARLAFGWFGDAVFATDGDAAASNARGGQAPTVDAVKLGEALHSHSFLRALLAAVHGHVVHWSLLRERVARHDPDFAALDPAEQEVVLESFLALIAHARVAVAGLDAARNRLDPFLTLQVQLWMREMSRLMRAVEDTPGFFWRDDIPESALRKGLPAYYCRECGHSGWLAHLRNTDDHLNPTISQIYRAYFDHSRHTCYIYPGQRTDQLAATGEHLCPHCLQVSYLPECEDCKTKTIAVIIHRELSRPEGANREPRDLHRCPQCGTDDALSIVGAQAPSLASVAISHLFTSPLNQDKKLLAFTDSVQDAAHRAAFFGARTYRFSLRTAMQTAVVATTEKGTEKGDEKAIGTNEGGIPLDRFTDLLLAHWRQRWQDEASGAPTEKPTGKSTGTFGSEQRLAATFMPPDLSELASYRVFLEGGPGPMPPALEADLRQRLSWEVVMEYGFNARVGRSLEKVGSSTAYLDPLQLDPAVDDLHLILREESGLLPDLSREDVRHFVAGLLERTRLRGGVDHLLLRRYAEAQGSWYLLGKKLNPLLSPFYRRSPRYPRFLTTTNKSRVFDTLVTSGAGLTWYVDWAQRNLSAQLGTYDVNEVYRHTVERLAERGLLRRYGPASIPAYGLVQSLLLISGDTTSIHCDVCNNAQTVAEIDAEKWEGRPCLNYQCQGAYTAVPEHSAKAGDSDDYYRALYGRGHVQRIVSREHTGLLARDVRENLEDEFKLQTRADAANLLTATPTLEMGIDIGDLSATLATSIPPSTANYLQRIGRAGRETGNALILAIANAKAHDLYFYAEPLEMLAGQVEPPGCFLNAPNMLRRQFLAYSMDSWTHHAAASGDLPRDVVTLLARADKGGFPAGFLTYYEAHSSQLIEHFLAFYGNAVDATNQEELHDFALNGELPRSIHNAIKQVREERDELRLAHRELLRELKKVQDDPAEFADAAAKVLEIQRELRLLQDLVTEINKKYILNFFTDSGLLPNYAFPETGVKLRAVIRDMPDDGPNTESHREVDTRPNGRQSERQNSRGYVVYEYLRPAALAIRELAPFNTFYAEGRKVKIDHVDIPGSDKAFEEWQFCARCNHMEMIQTSHYSKTCPGCGSPTWSDVGQRHAMLRLRQVSAWASHYDSLVGDDADDREQERYQVDRTFDVDAAYSAGAHLIPSLPFGLEHFKQVTLREVNFGLGELWGKTIPIANDERSAIGYRVCTTCGAVARPGEQEDEHSVKHTRNCTVKGGKEGITWRDVYLYREMVSEGLRILLPVSTLQVEEKLGTFAACLYLGLRRHLGGDPDHLQIVSHTEVGTDGTQRRYLMIYDTVPGGTSYLQDMAKPDTFRAVLEHARDVMATCSCRHDPEKQACYRCLYAYNLYADPVQVSRRLGLELVQEILNAWPQLEATPTLNDADMHSVLESELERRFVDALAAYASKNKQASMQPTLYQGKESWLLTVNGCRWRIEPQVLLDRDAGIELSSRADFVFRPLTAGLGDARPVAVFTDGYAYHVRPSEPQGRVADDVRKRQAIVASGGYWVWSISWDDVEEFAEGTKLPLSPYFDVSQEKSIHRLAPDVPNGILADNAVQQLLAYLASPQLDRWQKLARAMAVVTMLPLRPAISHQLIRQRVESLRTELIMPDLTIPTAAATGDQAYGIVTHADNLLFAHMEVAAFKQQRFEALTVWLRLNDTADRRVSPYFRNGWRRFLLLANLFQFHDGTHLLTTELIMHFGQSDRGLSSAVLDDGERKAVAASILSSDTVPSEWHTVFKIADPACKSLLEAALAAHTPLPVVGYEILNARGRVEAMAEVAWEEVRVAVLLADQPDPDRVAFVEAGWRLFTPDDVDALLLTIASHAVA